VGAQAGMTVELIREEAAACWGWSGGRDAHPVRGSVTVDNIAEFIGQPQIDGALVVVPA